MKCGRFYPKERYNCKQPKLSPDQEAISRTETATRILGQTKLQTNINRHCGTFHTITARFFNSDDGVVEYCDNPADYPEIFHKFVSTSIHSTGDFEQQRKIFKDEILKRVDEMGRYEQIIGQDQRLSNIASLFEQLVACMNDIDYVVPPNLKAALGTFEFNQSGEATETDLQISEFKRLLVYLYTTDSPLLKKYLDTMDKDGQNYTIEKGHREGIVAELIFILALEDIDEENEVSTYLRWVYTRCFKNKKGSLVLRSAGSNSSFCALAQHIIRMGTMALLAKPSEFKSHSEDNDHKMTLVEAVFICEPFQHSAMHILQFRRIHEKRAPNGSS